MKGEAKPRKAQKKEPQKTLKEKRANKRVATAAKRHASA